jgi:hypothetical protein
VVGQYLFATLVLVSALIWGASMRFGPHEKTPVDTDPKVRYARHIKHSHPEKENP